MRAYSKENRKDKNPTETPGIFVYNAPGERPSKVACSLSLPGAFIFKE